MNVCDFNYPPSIKKQIPFVVVENQARWDI